MRGTVRIDEAVAKEVSVAGHIFTEVTAISIILFSVFVFYKNTLIYPVPDPATLKVRIFVDSFPLSPKVTCRVTHCVSIFGRSNRTVAAFCTDLFQPSGTRILRNIHIRIPFPKGTFVVDRTVHQTFFFVFQVKVSLIEVISVTGFVTQRPDSY